MQLSALTEPPGTVVRLNSSKAGNCKLKMKCCHGNLQCKLLNPVTLIFSTVKWQFTNGDVCMLPFHQSVYRTGSSCVTMVQESDVQPLLLLDVCVFFQMYSTLQC